MSSHYYEYLLTDSKRISAFDRAIQKAVTPDDVVVDIGCGIGTYAIFAARAGARRVFGVDADPVIELAKQVAKSNQADVEFISGDALEVDLPEQATILIFEDFTTGLLDGPAREILNSTRKRWTAEQYRVLPEHVTLNLAPVNSASARRDSLPLEGLGERPYGLDFQPLAENTRNSMNVTRKLSDATLLAPARVVLNHSLLEPIPSCWSANGVFELLDKGDFDGLCLWLEVLLDKDESYSNTPISSGVWGQTFFPTPERLPVRSGDRLTFEIRFESTEIGGAWKWSFDLSSVDGETRTSWSSNTFASSAVTAESLRGYRPEDVVHLSPKAEREALILSLADGQRTLEEICTLAQERFRMPDRSTALALVLKTLEKRRIY